VKLSGNNGAVRIGADRCFKTAKLTRGNIKPAARIRIFGGGSIAQAIVDGDGGDGLEDEGNMMIGRSLGTGPGGRGGVCEGGGGA